MASMLKRRQAGVAPSLSILISAFVTSDGVLKAEKGSTLPTSPFHGPWNGEVTEPCTIVESRRLNARTAHAENQDTDDATANREFTREDLVAQTAGVCYRKDAGVIDEIPAAYKDIDAVMAAQADLVEV